MAIPDPDTFRRSTAPATKTIGGQKLGPISLPSRTIEIHRYGGAIGVVLEALNLYWNNRTAAVTVREALLYNLWKECRRWLKLKERKIEEESDTFRRRKLEITALRDEALLELTNISPQIFTALTKYEARKQNGVTHVPLKSLSPGYARERQIYLHQGKHTGHSVSHTVLHSTLAQSGNAELLQKTWQQKRFTRLHAKGFDNLSEADVRELEKLFPPNLVGGTWQVAFWNKIQRLQHLLTIEGGKFKDISDTPVSMTNQGWNNNYTLAAYVMDRYGNFYINTQPLNPAAYIDLSAAANIQPKPGAYFNHSSFLAGSDVICAGCCHIGYDVRVPGLVPGILSCIDNGSGHYKPDRQNLMNCLLELQRQGVNLRYVRVGDFSVNPVLFYWGSDFILGHNRPWQDSQNAVSNFNPRATAPPVVESAG